MAIVNSNGNTVRYSDIGGYRYNAQDKRGNGYYGVAVVGGSGNTIGPKNIIAHNGLTTASAGVWIDGATAQGNHITQNSIFDNGGEGISTTNGSNGGLASPNIYVANCNQVYGTAAFPGLYRDFFGLRGRRADL